MSILDREPANKFERDCYAASNALDISVYFPWRDENKATKVYEDDGCLHIHKSGSHACFGIDQDKPLREQNERITKVLVALKLEKWLKVPHILASEDECQQEEDEENDVCPNCGRSH